MDPASDQRTSELPPRPAGSRGTAGRLLGVLLAAVVVAGCAIFGGGQGQDEAAERSGHITVWVQNHNWAAVHVRIRGSGALHRTLGMVASQDTALYKIPISALGPRQELRLAADPVADRGAFVTEPIYFEPGYRIEWTVRQPLVQSSVMVR